MVRVCRWICRLGERDQNCDENQYDQEDNMAGRVDAIYRIMVTIQIGMLIQLRVPRYEPAYLRIIISCADVSQATVAIVAVRAIRGELVGVAGGAGGGDGAAEAFEG